MSGIDLNIRAPPIILGGVQIGSGTIQFSWNTVFGLTYQLQYTTNLNQPTWTLPPGTLTPSGYYSFGSTTGPAMITSGGPTLTVLNTFGSGQRGFYRVAYVP